MGQSDLPSPAVIVGVEGSSDGLPAALWAVDEAVSRDIPLRLICVLDPDSEPGTPRGAAELDTAELAIRHLVTAVESTDMPVKIEVETLYGRLTDALLQASQSAAMICVASCYGTTPTQGAAGSTVAALAASVACPVTVVRSDPTAAADPGWIVVTVDDSPASDGVLKRGLEEARLRHAPLRVLVTSRMRFTDIHDTTAVASRNRWAKACLDRRLAPWREQYPDVEIRAVAVHGNVLTYLARNLKSIQLVIAGGEQLDGLGDLLDPRSDDAIRNTDCSVMICETRPPP